MSKYTTELRFICEQKAGKRDSSGYNSIAETIEAARPAIFSFDYPIFDPEYKSVLETLIIKHFYTREIGEETFGLWQLRLDSRMNEIMPFYNKLYSSELIEFNPLYDTDITKTYTKNDSGSESGSRTDNKTTGITDGAHENFDSTDTGTNTHTSSDTAEDWRLFNDTPQGGINGIEAEVNAFNFLTDATKETHSGSGSDTLSNSLRRVHLKDNTYTRSQTESGTGSNTKTLTNLQSYTEHVTGHGSATTLSKALTEFRETFININKMVIDELNDLFINLW